MANANWLHDASVVAAQVVKEAAGKLFNYSAYLKDAESQLDDEASSLAFAAKKQAKALAGATVTHNEETFRVKDIEVSQNEDYEWELTLTLAEPPGQTHTITGYDVKDTGPVTANGKPVDVAKFLKAAKDQFMAAEDQIAIETTKTLTKLLKGKTVELTNPQKPTPQEIEILEVIVSPGWEQDYSLTLGYVNPKNDKRTTAELTTGYDTIAFTE